MKLKKQILLIKKNNRTCETESKTVLHCVFLTYKQK